MQYHCPVSDSSWQDGAVRSSAALMTQPHAAFAHHSILGVRISAAAEGSGTMRVRLLSLLWIIDRMGPAFWCNTMPAASPPLQSVLRMSVDHNQHKNTACAAEAAITRWIPCPADRAGHTSLSNLSGMIPLSDN